MFVATRDIRFAKGRFALMIAVVAMVALLVVLLTGLTAGLAADSTSAVTGLPADHIAFGATAADPGFADSTVTTEQWQRWAAADGVDAAAPFGVAQTRLQIQGGRSAPVSLFGIEAASPLAPRITSGVGLTDKPGGIVLSTGLADDLGVSTGDAVGLGTQTVPVVGVAGDASYGHAPAAWVTLERWQSVAPGARAGTATAIALTTTAKADIGGDDAAFGTTTMPLGDAAATVRGFAEENGSLTMIRVFLFAISALVVGAFFTVWTVQRKPEIAVLKALGASTSYLMRDALSQAGIVLVAAGALGAIVGFGAGLLARQVVPFVVSPTTLLVPVLVLAGVGLVGAAAAVRRIAAVDPLTALGAAR